MTKKTSILVEAEALTSDARQKAYGHPRDNFNFIAELWNTWLNNKAANSVPVEGAQLTAEDVGMMMLLVKVSREGHAHSRDNLVDIAGYAKTIQMVEEAK